MTILIRATLTFGIFFFASPFVAIMSLDFDRVQQITKVVGIISAVGLLACGIAAIWTAK